MKEYTLTVTSRYYCCMYMSTIIVGVLRQLYEVIVPVYSLYIELKYFCPTMVYEHTGYCSYSDISCHKYRTSVHSHTLEYESMYSTPVKRNSCSCA